MLLVINLITGPIARDMDIILPVMLTKDLECSPLQSLVKKIPLSVQALRLTLWD